MGTTLPTGVQKWLLGTASVHEYTSRYSDGRARRKKALRVKNVAGVSSSRPHLQGKVANTGAASERQWFVCGFG